VEEDRILHDLIANHLKRRLSREYKEITANLTGETKHEFKGFYPDLILSNHGVVLAIMEVETEDDIKPDKAEQWKAMSELGVKLIVMAPKTLKAKLTGLLWDKGIAGKVALGTYEIAINMP
jgi:hypothetical protein